MIKTVPSARRAMVAEFRQAQRFIQTLPPCEHYFTARTGESSYNYKAESPDWFFAIGGYTYWGKGVAKVLPRQHGNRYEVAFSYCFFDRYNWDGGKSVDIAGITITDEFMAEFHREGPGARVRLRRRGEARIHLGGHGRPAQRTGHIEEAGPR